jgi:ankyrin repeat protein
MKKLLSVFTGIMFLVACAQVPLEKQLFQAIEKQDAGMVKNLLEKGADPNARDEGDNAALFLAVQKSDLQIVQLLVEKGADINANTPVFGSSILAVAASIGDEQIVQFFLDHGAKINSGPQSPLVSAINNNKVSIVEKLIAHGVNPLMKLDNYQQANNATLIMVAVMVDSPEIVQLLVKAGVNVNDRDSYGDHALNWAAYFNKPNVVPVLIAAGSQLNVRGLSGHTALDHAISQKSDDVKPLLEKAGALRAEALN